MQSQKTSGKQHCDWHASVPAQHRPGWCRMLPYEPYSLLTGSSRSMQAGVMLVLGTALAETPVFQRLIRRLVGVARTPRALVGLTAGVAIALGLVNWSLSLIGGALLAKAAGGRARAQRGAQTGVGPLPRGPLLCSKEIISINC